MGSFVFAPSVLHGGSGPKRRKIDYDVAKFSDATCAESFCELVRNIPPIPITVDNTSHCHLADTFIFDALCKSFPKDTHRKRQQFISESTYESIRELGKLRREVFRAYARFWKF